MSKLIDDGLFVANCSTSSAFKKFKFTARNANNGVELFRRYMVISVASNPEVDETFGIGTKTYTFKASGATGDQINLGADKELTTPNIIAKINLDRAYTGCSAYALGSDTKILLIENVAGFGGIFTPDAPHLVLGSAWAWEITEADLEDTDYFEVDNTIDTATIPVELTEQNAGTKNNFLY